MLAPFNDESGQAQGCSLVRHHARSPIMIGFKRIVWLMVFIALTFTATTRAAVTVVSPCGGTNDTSLIQTAINTGNTVILSPGTCRVLSTLTISTTGQTVEGAGFGGTTITFDTESGTALSITGNYVIVKNLALTSTGLTRSGSGIVIDPNAGFVEIMDVHITKQSIGLVSQGAAPELRRVLVEQCLSHGIALDGSQLSQGINEAKFYSVQSNTNGGDGLNITGGSNPSFGGAGLHLLGFTATGNTLYGIRSSAGSGGAGMGAVWVVAAELSGNNRNLVIEQATNAVFWTIQGGLFEASTNESIVLTGGYHTVTGATISGGSSLTNGTGVLIESTDTIVSNNVIKSAGTAGIIHGSSAARVALTGNVVSACALGLRFDAGGTAVSITGGNYASNTSTTAGSIPSGSRISAAIGLTDQ
jgi:hypothetical protein